MKQVPISIFGDFVIKYENIDENATDCACPDGIPYSSIPVDISWSLNIICPWGLGSRIKSFNILLRKLLIIKNDIYNNNKRVRDHTRTIVVINNNNGP